jgi:glycine/D-amino acid oxidase-like deaminating enzyme
MQEVPVKAQHMDAALSLPKLTWKTCLGMLTTFTCSAAKNLHGLTLSFCIASTQYLQVHPAKLTHALMSAAEEAAGARLLIGTITGVNTAAGAVTGVRVQQRQQHDVAAGSSSEVEVPADVVVLALGPWTEAARAWLPTAPEMSGVCSNTALLQC